MAKNEADVDSAVISSHSGIGERFSNSFFLFLSVLVHVLIGSFFANRHSSKDTSFSQVLQQEQVPVRVVQPSELSRQLVQQLKLKTGTIVQTERQKSVETSAAKTVHFGEFSQRVARESRLPQLGVLSEQSGELRAVEESNPGHDSALEGNTGAPSLGALGLSPSVGWEVLAQKGSEFRGRRAREGLPRGSSEVLSSDIPIGDRTLLNTEEMLFSSYFNRLKERVVPRWRLLLDDLRNERVRLVTGLYETRLDVVLDENGEVLQVWIRKSSGSRDLDLAAEQAFWTAKRVENPPRGLIGRDHTIVLSDLGFLIRVGGKVEWFRMETPEKDG